MKENQEKNQEPKQEEQETSKDRTKMMMALVVGLTAVLVAFMIFGISNINLDKDVKKADLLVEEESYKEAIDIYDRVLSSKNSPEVKEKRDIAMNLMYPDGKPEDAGKDDKVTADKEDKKDKKEEDKIETAEEEEETDDQEEEDETEDSLDLDLPMKSVWAPRANIRSQPSESASVVGVITKGTEIYIEDEQVESPRRTWYKIITELNGERIEGWMASNTLNN